jgi:hypothetical protein
MTRLCHRGQAGHLILEATTTLDCRSRRLGDKLDAMPAIAVDGDELVVTLEPSEKRWGLLSDLRVPVSAVATVDVVADGRRAVHGIRAPGLGGSQRLIGTWRAKQDRQYVCVRRDQPAVKVVVDGQRYRTILIGSDDAERIAAEIRAAAANEE